MKLHPSVSVAATLWQLARGQRDDAPRQVRRGVAPGLRDAAAAAAQALRSKGAGRWFWSSSSSDDEAAAVDVESPISGPYKYASSQWATRKIAADVVLDAAAFDDAVVAWSESLCGLGITATLFDEAGDLVSQTTVGSRYTPLVEGGYSMGSGHGSLQEGWTGDTVFTPYSNSKGVAAATFLSSIVDTGLGFLEEPIRTTFPHLTGADVGRITPRQILSHSSGLQSFNREAYETDPYYSCKYDDSKTLRECLETFVLTDDALRNPPGTMTSYNNEAFDILAVVVEEKTGMSFGEAYQQHIAGPLGMCSTTYDCPVVKSTPEKPGVAWGLCSTGNDFPKFVQMLARDGWSPAGEPVLSKDSVRQMFSPGGGTAQNAGDLLWNGTLPFYMTRCYPRMVKGILKDVDPSLAEVTLPVTSVSGYGLGTMFFLGNQGEIFGHAGSTGGTWLVAPGRFSVYLTWMASGATAPAIAANTYTFVADVLNALESASAVTMESALGTGGGGAQEIGTCGGTGMYEDLFAYLGIEAMSDMYPTQCPDDAGRGSSPAAAAHPLAPAMKAAGDTARRLL